jgi:hypothetical protein
MTRALAGGAFLVLALATAAEATPLTWGFQGSVIASQVAAFPLGTPVDIAWTADPAAPNACASSDPQVGMYFGQTLTETIGGTAYSIGGILTVGTTLARGCSGPADTSVQLNLVAWSGPGAFEGALVTSWVCCSAPAMVWNNGLPTSAFPTLPPSSALLQGPSFAGGRAAVASSVRAIQAVPEPTTLTLIGLGGLMLRRRIMTR